MVSSKPLAPSRDANAEVDGFMRQQQEAQAKTTAK